MARQVKIKALTAMFSQGKTRKKGEVFEVSESIAQQLTTSSGLAVIIPPTEDVDAGSDDSSSQPGTGATGGGAEGSAPEGPADQTNASKPSSAPEAAANDSAADPAEAKADSPASEMPDAATETK
ncbi:MAG TPA: hypothetical protein DDW52_14975 [Planctomycetaceae bacterium]|nr:hypothetical protein [Planctomycetaceae bacterium]